MTSVTVRLVDLSNKRKHIERKTQILEQAISKELEAVKGTSSHEELKRLELNAVLQLEREGKAIEIQNIDRQITALLHTTQRLPVDANGQQLIVTTAKLNTVQGNEQILKTAADFPIEKYRNFNVKKKQEVTAFEMLKSCPVVVRLCDTTQWVQIRCHICHANRGRKRARFLDPAALVCHLTSSHGVNADSVRASYILSNCVVKSLSHEEVSAINRNPKIVKKIKRNKARASQFHEAVAKALQPEKKSSLATGSNITQSKKPALAGAARPSVVGDNSADEEVGKLPATAKPFQPAVSPSELKKDIGKGTMDVTNSDTAMKLLHDCLKVFSVSRSPLPHEANEDAPLVEQCEAPIPQRSAKKELRSGEMQTEATNESEIFYESDFERELMSEAGEPAMDYLSDTELNNPTTGSEVEYLSAMEYLSDTEFEAPATIIEMEYLSDSEFTAPAGQPERLEMSSTCCSDGDYEIQSLIKTL